MSGKVSKSPPPPPRPTRSTGAPAPLKPASAPQPAGLSKSSPRPAVRPAGPPQKVMPKTPPPPPQAKSLSKAPAAPARVSPPNTAAAFVPATVGLIALNTAIAHETISSEAGFLQSSLNDLQTRSSFSDMHADITNLDSSLNRVSELLESARLKNYQYQGDLEKKLYSAQSSWTSARPQVLSSIQQQSRAFQSQLAPLNAGIQQLNARLGNPTAATPLLQSTKTQVNSLLSNLSQVQQNIENTYSEIKKQAQEMTTRLHNIHWAVDQLAGAKFSLEAGEALVMAVATRWDKEGKEDPEGVLYLSDKRLIFERKEKVATKKILFITTASELVQEVLINQPLANVRDARPENKGLFGHQDFVLTQFADPKLGSVAFHINGQPAKEWAGMIERARTGQLQAEKASMAGGLSMKDLNRPISTADILSMQNEVNNLQDEMMLKEVRQELGRLENAVSSLERKLGGLRSQGYEVEKDLEADITILFAQWQRVKANAESTLDHQSRTLGEQMQSIQNMLSQLVGMSNNLNAARPLYMQLKSAVASAEAQAAAAEDTVLAQYGQYAAEVEALDAHMDWVGWMLEALHTASFRLLATECGIAAAEAVFQLPGCEAENGVLFLTDQRLLWEDRVDAYELKIYVPLQDVLDVRKEVGEDGQDVLVFSFGPQGQTPTGSFSLGQSVGDDWIKMVKRARSGGYARDKAVSLSNEELERVRNAPTQCPNCGAAMTSPILRGQSEIRCEYCSFTVRL